MTCRSSTFPVEPGGEALTRRECTHAAMLVGCFVGCFVCVGCVTRPIITRGYGAPETAPVITKNWFTAEKSVVAESEALQLLAAFGQQCAADPHICVPSIQIVIRNRTQGQLAGPVPLVGPGPLDVHEFGIVGFSIVTQSPLTPPEGAITQVSLAAGQSITVMIPVAWFLGSGGSPASCERAQDLEQFKLLTQIDVSRGFLVTAKVRLAGAAVLVAPALELTPNDFVCLGEEPAHGASDSAETPNP